MQWTSNILTPHALLLNAIHLLQATADIKDLRHQGWNTAYTDVSLRPVFISCTDQTFDQ